MLAEEGYYCELCVNIRLVSGEGYPFFRGRRFVFEALKETE